MGLGEELVVMSHFFDKYSKSGYGMLCKGAVLYTMRLTCLDDSEYLKTFFVVNKRTKVS